MARKITAHTVQVARRAKIGEKAEAATETWAQRQARVTAERAAKAEQRRREAEQEG